MPAESSPEPLTVDLPHLTVSALAWGPADGPLALCLHGYPDTAWTWRHLGPALAAQGYRVVAPFSRGYAPTGIPADGDYHVGALMFDAIALHEHLGGGSDTVLIGHDWGGFTALGLAAHPDSPFAKVAALGIPLIPGFRHRMPMHVLRRMPAQLRMSWYVLYQQLPFLPERTLDRVIPTLWRDWTPSGYDSTDDLARLWAALPDRAHRTAALSYYRFLAQPRPVAAPYRSLQRSTRQPPRIPVLLLHGEGDGSVDAELAAFSAEHLPAGSRHEIIASAGHFIQLDQPEQVNRLILDYLAA